MQNTINPGAFILVFIAPAILFYLISKRPDKVERFFKDRAWKLLHKVQLSETFDANQKSEHRVYRVIYQDEEARELYGLLKVSVAGECSLVQDDTHGSAVRS